jgi:hypothetical protein
MNVQIFKIVMGKAGLNFNKYQKQKRLVRSNSQLSMNKTFLILLLANAIYSEDRFILCLQAEVSKRFYLSKAKSSTLNYFELPIGTVNIDPDTAVVAH